MPDLQTVDIHFNSYYILIHDFKTGLFPGRLMPRVFILLFQVFFEVVFPKVNINLQICNFHKFILCVRLGDKFFYIL